MDVHIKLLYKYILRRHYFERHDLQVGNLSCQFSLCAYGEADTSAEATISNINWRILRFTWNIQRYTNNRVLLALPRSRLAIPITCLALRITNWWQIDDFFVTKWWRNVLTYPVLLRYLFTSVRRCCVYVYTQVNSSIYIYVCIYIRVRCRRLSFWCLTELAVGAG